MKLSFEKVARDSFSEGDSAGMGKLNVPTDVGRSDTDNVQPSMPVLTRQFVGESQDFSELRLLHIGEFRSVARLYRLDPVLEFLREWNFIECAIYEVTRLGVNGKVQAAFVGGRMGSAQLSGRFEYRSAESRSQLVEKLAQFERDVDAVPIGLKKTALTTATPSRSTPIVKVQEFYKKIAPEICGSLSVKVRPRDSVKAICES